MFKLLLVFALVCTSGLKADLFDWFHSLSPKAQRAQEIMKELEPTVELALQDYQTPGMAIGLVVDGELVYAKGFGFRDVEKKLPITTETLFAIGSCTKAFTAFVVGTCVENGELGWDTPLIDTIPELHLWNYDTTHHLTYRDVLTHRSGMPRHEFLWYNAKMSREDLVKKLKNLEPCCNMRQRYIYNNLMYSVVGLGLEKITGQSWENLVSEKILKPLGMKRTNFTIEATEKSHDYALPYAEKAGRLRCMAMRDLTAVGPAASINSNIEDLAQWVKMHLAKGTFNDRVLIQPSTLQEIMIPQVITSGTPEAEDTAFSAYGIGWHISSYRDRYFISHDGISDGFTSVVGILPRENIGIIVLVNKNLTVLPRFVSLQAIDRILELPFIDWLKEGLDGIKKTRSAELEKNRKDDPTRKIGTHPSHPLSDYVGEYVNAAYGSLTIDLCGDKLRVRYNDIPYILDHWHYDVFAIDEEPEPFIVSIEGSKFTFHNNVNGDISEVTFPFEPSVKEIVFKRKANSAHASLQYLRKFTGIYEIYGYTVDVTIRNGVLSAIIPGQPVYELVPSSENEFNVKSKTGFNVRFVLDEEGKVVEVLLMQPYGTFSAKPKR